MIDQNSQFFAILTEVGEAKQANATALGQSWTFAQMGVGDANGTDPIPNRTQTRLINEWRRAAVNQVRTDPANPNIIITEQVIPADVGGKWIREIGLYDAAGDLVAVANCAPSFKPLLVQGTGKTQIIRMNFIVASTASVVLKIDPAIVLATREYVDTQIVEAMAKMDFKHSVLVATTASIALSGVQTIDGVLLPADARVLVKNQGDAKENGLYVVSSTGVWKRTQDADSSAEVTPGLFVSVEKGTANGDSVWQLVTDAPIVLGTTALAFEMAVGRTGVSAGSYANVTVDKYGRVIAGTNPTTLAGHGITDGLRVGAVSQQYPILAAPAPGGVDNTGTGGALQIREAQEVGAAQTTLDYAPRILFHWQGLKARDLAMSNLGDLLWGSNLVYHGGNFSPASKANLASPAFTGTPTAPTATAGTNTTQLANTAFVWSAVNAYATTVTASLNLKADLATSLRIGSVSRQRPILSGPIPAGADNGGDGAGGAAEIREVQEVGNTQSDMKYAPSLLFNWSSKFARYLKMSPVGDLVWGDKKVFTEGNITDVLATVAMQPNGRVLIPTKDGTPLYLQWYEGPLAGAETVAYPAVSHPVPFPTECLFAGVFTRSTSSNTLSDQMFQMEYWDRLGVKVFPQWFGTGNQSLVKPLIFAIGN
ncbi:phage tail protein [Pseudomonas extremorientalis]|uniref:Phage tail-collar fibre protein n=1 Tax=Pseudomonas extremorientalis TaxID=169669 RepID=A0ABY0RXL2_9PSED|nr:phage tail protein [Pseudomonas extremorientalis]SDO59888.1 Phage tail-collar fibre protein [Pseudomonas extremorientalis]